MDMIAVERSTFLIREPLYERASSFGRDASVHEAKVVMLFA
jgi:hypothetical protein